MLEQTIELEPNVEIKLLPKINELLTKGYKVDLTLNLVLDALRNGELHHLKLTLAECLEIRSCLYYRERLYVPNYDKLRLKLLRLSHNSVIARHPRRAKTYELLSYHYY